LPNKNRKRILVLTCHGIAILRPVTVFVVSLTLGVVNNFSFGILELGV
jgi:hypothetical protein